MYVFLTRKNIQSPKIGCIFVGRMNWGLSLAFTPWNSPIGAISKSCHSIQIQKSLDLGCFFSGGFPFQWVPRHHRFPHHPLGGEGASAASPSTVASEEEAACHLSGHLKPKLIQMVGFSQRVLYWWKWWRISLLDMGMTNKAFWTLEKHLFSFLHRSWRDLAANTPCSLDEREVRQQT